MLQSDYLRLPEVEVEDLCDCMDFEDFPRRYGNPVIVNVGGQKDLVCMARDYYERLMYDLCKPGGDDGIKYWIYEFEMSQEAKRAFEHACVSREMTADEFFEAAIKGAIRRAKTEPESIRKVQQEIEAHPEQFLQIHLVRRYPVVKGETEAQALKRKLAEETAEGQAPVDQDAENEQHHYEGRSCTNSD